MPFLLDFLMARPHVGLY